MLKNIIILLIVVLSMRIFPSDEKYSIKYSKYIPINSPFYVSLITSKIFPASDEIRITIIPDSKTILNRVELRNENANQKIPFIILNSGTNSKSYALKISFNDTVFFSSEFFQILFNFNSESTVESLVKFKAEFYRDNNFLGDLIASNHSREEENQAAAKISFYKPQGEAGKCLELTSSSEFIVDVQEDSIKNLLMQFWFKNLGEGTNFLKVLNNATGKILFDIEVNKFQIFEMFPTNQMVDFYNSFFVSSKSWNYLTLHFSFEDKKLYLYCNSILVARLNLSFDFISENVRFIFFNSNPEKPVQFEQVRLIDYRKKQIKNAFDYSSSTEFRADSSTVLLQFNFDEISYYPYMKDNFTVTSENIRYANSDAPIYPSSPNVKINFFTHYNEIEWQGGDYKLADKYILERSVNGSPFLEIYSVAADNESEKIFSVIDQREANSEIIYYRIKTINNDSSVFTSAQLKVGQGGEEQFNLIQNYPNPFNPKTSIEVELFVDTDVDVIIYNLEGKLIQKIFDGFLSNGKHKFDFDASDLSSGIYLYKVTTPVSSQVKKMLLTK